MHRSSLFGVALAIVFASPAVLSDDELLFAQVTDTDSRRLPSLTVAPEYPRKARRDRIEGEVQVCFDIDREGRPLRIAVRKSSNRAFEKPSIKAVRASSFRPLRKDQPLQSLKSCRTFRFSLQPVEE
jgi:TonB family protein